MNPLLLEIAAVAAAYLIGAIPFGYLTARWFGGIDIRTVGSGNIGATNVGRNLGFRFFVLVFALDLAKGLLPTWGFPKVYESLSGQASPILSVLVAVATVLGHNLPVYLSFKGGKGVATSLGAVLALDAIAGLAAGAGFVVALVVCRYVSLSSLLGALVFCAVHFVRVPSPWSPEQRAMSVITIALVVLLLVRHHKNLGRIVAGTEPKVRLRKPKDEHPRGRITVAWLIALVVFGALGMGATALCRNAARREVLTVGRYELSEVARVGTGHQRAERVVFAEGGRLLAVTCPRYNRLVLYRVLDNDGLELLNDLELEGKPVAVCASRDRLLVLERPPGDERHVAQGWWETFDLRGERIGEKVRVGFYPDDMALSLDGRHAFVLTSGQAEGDSKKPAPALDVYDIEDGSKAVGHLEFDGPRDDPARLVLSATGGYAAVTLLGSDVSAAVDLVDRSRPRLIGRTALADVDRPYPSRSEDDSIIMPVRSGREAVSFWLEGVGDCVAATLSHGSGLDFSLTTDHRALGRLTLRGGVFGLGTTRPIGLAYSPDRRLLAVANRSGSVHLVAIRAQTQQVAHLR